MDAELGVALPEPVDIHVGRADLAEGLDGMSLSLIDIAEVERILLLDRVSQRFNAHYEAQLDPLILRSVMATFLLSIRCADCGVIRPACG